MHSTSTTKVACKQPGRHMHQADDEGNPPQACSIQGHRHTYLHSPAHLPAKRTQLAPLRCILEDVTVDRPRSSPLVPLAWTFMQDRNVRHFS